MKTKQVALVIPRVGWASQSNREAFARLRAFLAEGYTPRTNHEHSIVQSEPTSNTVCRIESAQTHDASASQG